MTQHLSSAQISEWLIGPRTAQQEAHVRECSECSMAIERLEESIAMYRGAVRGWGESRLPVAQPVERERSAGLLWLRVASMTAAMGLALGLVVATVAVPVYRERARQAAEIERQDEVLLWQVHVDSSRSVAAPMEPLTQLISKSGEKSE